MSTARPPRRSARHPAPRTAIPDALPVLAAGAHRNPRDGGCFMEWASLLAGERWSDEPRCTHPLLAHLARSVNDRVGVVARQELAALVPSVIGLRSPDPRWDVEIALLVGRTALPWAAGDDARALAAGVLTCDRVLAHGDRRPAGAPRASTREALDAVPLAQAWARDFTARTGVPRGRPQSMARAVVDHAVATTTRGADRDARLVALLRAAVGLGAALCGRPAPSPALRARPAVPSAV